ncbi:MAG TPA: SRPBCC domain-containing protein [Candidatus Acidoferrum sp.]|nr:SRPBCC domain-containing protein [Candidatus Acidoferrum sp.]
MSEPGKVLPFDVPPVVKTVTVRCPPATAFRRFTDDLAAWWPLATHHIGGDPQTCALEGRIGGRLFERGKDGSEKVWGAIELWDPPRRLAFTWQVNIPAEQAQRIEVTFAPVAGGTRVELVHSGWEKLGEAAAARRDSYDKGWGRVFGQCFADYANAGGT